MFKVPLSSRLKTIHLSSECIITQSPPIVNYRLLEVLESFIPNLFLETPGKYGRRPSLLLLPE